MRTNHFKNVRMEFKDSRFFLGKNKVMKVALGRTPAEEYSKNICKLGDDINGSTGLLFTNKPEADVTSYFNSLAIKDYAKSGFVATESVKLDAGVLDQFTGSMHDNLHKLGLPVKLDTGKLILERDFTVCSSGDVLTPEQAKVLVFFGKKMADFKIELISKWENDTYTKK